MTDIAKIVSKLQDLFWFGIPKNKRDYQRAIKPAEFMDERHVMIVRIDPGSDPEEHYIGKEKQDDPIRFSPPSYDFGQLICVDAAYLKALCEAADDAMYLVIEEKKPLRAYFSVGGRDIVAYIAPRIDNQ